MFGMLTSSDNTLSTSVVAKFSLELSSEWNWTRHQQVVLPADSCRPSCVTGLRFCDFRGLGVIQG